MANSSFFSFPDPVNEIAARTVATGVVIMVAAFEISSYRPILLLLVYGFLVRTLAGPKISPLGRFATQVVAGRLIGGGRRVPGPPKRFAQGIGLTFSAAMVLLSYTNHVGAARVIGGVLLFFALLESALGFCAGCKVYGILQRFGLVKEVCEECSDLTFRSRRLRENSPS